MRAITTTASLVGIALLLGLVLPRGAARADEGHRADLILVLNGIDTLLDRELLLLAGAGDDGEALREVVEDATLPRYTRVRAATALSYFPSRENRDALAAAALDADEDPEVRIAAISVFGWSEIPDPEPVLIATASARVGHDDIRATAIRAAGRLAPERGLPVLAAIRSQLAPGDRFERVVIEDLERLEAAGQAPR